MIEFTVPPGNAFVICGLSGDNPDNSPRSIDYGILLTDIKNVVIWENGVNVAAAAN
jgi:hypothetical protein